MQNPFMLFDPDDDRLHPGAYITNGHDLFMVLDQSSNLVALQDCKTDDVSSIAPWFLTRKSWRLVQRAPQVPDHIDHIHDDAIAV